MQQIFLLTFRVRWREAKRHVTSGVGSVEHRYRGCTRCLQEVLGCIWNRIRFKGSITELGSPVFGTTTDLIVWYRNMYWFNRAFLDRDNLTQVCLQCTRFTSTLQRRNYFYITSIQKWYYCINDITLVDVNIHVRNDVCCISILMQVLSSFEDKACSTTKTHPQSWRT